jgi:tripartite-type tricarboxylate transporter receptor subunit TctC
MKYIGSTTSEIGVTVAWGTAPQKTAADLFKQEMIVGGNGTATDTELFARALNRLIGTKFRIIGGYPGETEIELAMERGELQGVANWSWNDIPTMHPDWLRDKKIRILMQLGLHKVKGLENVPLTQEFAHTPEEKKTLDLMMTMKSLGRPFILGPQVSKERVSELRTAFDQTMNDPAYIADIEKSGGSLDPTSGTKMQRLLEDIYSASPELIKRVRDAMAP